MAKGGNRGSASGAGGRASESVGLSVKYSGGYGGEDTSLDSYGGGGGAAGPNGNGVAGQKGPILTILVEMAGLGIMDQEELVELGVTILTEGMA
jgi:hypothetical protein